LQTEDVLKGQRYAVFAYLCWGFFPLYWKLLQHVPAIQILFHRVLWAAVFYFSYLFLIKKTNFNFKIFKTKILVMLLASALVTVNWFIYIYAVTNNHILDSSLGYFINPLVHVLNGVIFLKEKLNRNKKIAFLFGAVGLLILTYDLGHIPWIALSLAFSFAYYGFIKKQANLSGFESCLFEAIFAMAPVFLIMNFTSTNWLDNHFQFSTLTWIYLIFGGIVTGLPLIWFTEAARRIPLNTLGLFQYISPSIQFCIGAFVFSEAISPLRWLGFICIWIGLAQLVLRKNQPSI